MKTHHIDNIFKEMIEDVRYVNIYSKFYVKTMVKNNE